MKTRPSRLKRWLQSVPKPVLVFFAVGAAFSTYFAMHALRKPYLAAQYDGFSFFNMELKTALEAGWGFWASAPPVGPRENRRIKTDRNIAGEKRGDSSGWLMISGIIDETC